MARYVLVERFGFTPARRRGLLRLIDLGAGDHRHAAALQKTVIAPHGDDIIDRFYRALSIRRRLMA